MARQRYIAVGGTWVPAEEFQQAPETHHVMPDIAPYQAMFIDKATGIAPMVTSRSQHRELLRRNDLQEVGNEVKAHMDQVLRREVPRDPRLKQRLIEVAAEKLRYK